VAELDGEENFFPLGGVGFLSPRPWGSNKGSKPGTAGSGCVFGIARQFDNV
jgi:hypothetical protein